MPEPGDIRTFRIGDVLGPDPAGLVYAATAPDGRPAAVTVVAPDLATDDGVRARFRDRIEAARRLHGPWMVPVLDAGPDAPRPWLATALVPGPSLEHAVHRSGPLPLTAVSALGRTLATALTDAHRRGTTHGDVQPARIVLGPDGPWLHGPVPGGQSLFTSPEQASGEREGPASDVFSLAATLVFAATGHSPFGDGDPLAVARRITDDDPHLGDVPPPLRDLAWLCLNRSAAERPAMRELIAHLPGTDPGPSPGPDPGPVPAGRSVSRRTLLLAAGATGAALLAGGYAVVRGTRPPGSPPGTADAGTVQPLWTDLVPGSAEAVLISGDVVVVGGSGTVVALNAGGGLRWRWAPEPAPGADTGFDPLGVTLGVTGGVVAAATRGVVAALDPATGRALWTLAPRPRQLFETLAGVDAGAGAGLVHVAVGNRIEALDAATGRPRWTHEVPGLLAGAPTVGGSRCLIPSNAGVDAVDTATGRPVWRYTIGELKASTLTVAGPLAYMSIAGLGVRALDLLTGEVRWEAEIPGADLDPPAVAGGLVLLTAMEQQVHALRVDDGSRAWTGPGPDTGRRARVVTGGGGGVYTGDEVGRVLALNAATGAVRWTAEPANSSSVYGIAATDTLVVATTYDGTIRAYAA